MKMISGLLACFLIISHSSFVFAKPEIKSVSISLIQDEIQKYASIGDFMKNCPDLYHLSSINNPVGMAVQDGEIMLFGETKPSMPQLTVDDLAVCIRSILLSDSDNVGVSIDPRPLGKGDDLQDVRYEGDIQDTQFGKDCFEADYLLKLIQLDKIQNQIDGVESYYRHSVRNSYALASSSHKILVRFWFVSPLARTQTNFNAVKLPRVKLDLGIEVMAAEIDGEIIKDLSKLHHKPAEFFVRDFRSKTSEYLKLFPVLSRLNIQTRLLAVCKGFMRVRDFPGVDFWIDEYDPSQVKCPETVEAVRAKYPDDGRHLDVASEFPNRNKSIELTITGGVDLQTFADLDPNFDAEKWIAPIINQRPDPKSISWRVDVPDDWIDKSPPIEENAPIRGLNFTRINKLLGDAQNYLARNRYTDAISIYDKIIEIEEGISRVYLQKAICYKKLNKPDQARSCYESVLIIKPTSIDALLGISDIYRKQSQSELESLYLNRVRRFYPKSSRFYSVAARLSMVDDDLRIAQSYLIEGLKINDRDADLWTESGFLNMQINNMEKAIESFMKATELKPDSSEAHYGKALAFKAIDNLKIALESVKKACELSPMNYEYLKLKAQLEDSMNLYWDSQDTYKLLKKIGNNEE